ncbi:MAG: M48 family metallopeptidase [Alphaproteobacteria bacterium]|nr:M48 family metallopeptidase [Alphaproteobacteria bacterium]MBN2780181.1 M48 family metallopeptidase [Alphaproteobacteria bacterium]
MGFAVEPIFRISTRAKSISLRPLFDEKKVVLTLPHARFQKQALEFFDLKKSWIERQFYKYQNAIKQKAVIEPGAVISICGEDLLLKQAFQSGVFKQGNTLFVSGLAEAFESRVRRFAKKEFERYALKRTRFYADLIDKTVQSVQVKAMRSRWGSCGSEGKIALAEQLAFAPDFVMDYVIAHEVAHLQEMNHSSRFWALVDEIYEGDVIQAKAWLRVHGKTII